MSQQHDTLEAIEDQVAAMAGHARGMLRDGLRALEELDRDLAVAVASRSDALAQMDEDSETAILQYLTLNGPVASDMRRMGTALKLITYINRIGRYGYDIARIARDWPEAREHVGRMVNLRSMADKVEAMMAIVLAAFRQDSDLDLAEITALEADVDAQRYSIFREALSYMQESPANIEPCTQYVMVARYLERCGDNICKMAEKQHYAATGERLIL